MQCNAMQTLCPCLFVLVVGWLVGWLVAFDYFRNRPIGTSSRLYDSLPLVFPLPACLPNKKQNGKIHLITVSYALRLRRLSITWHDMAGSK